MAVTLVKSAPPERGYRSSYHSQHSRQSPVGWDRSNGSLDFSLFRRLFAENMKQHGGGPQGGPTLYLRGDAPPPHMAHTLPMTHRSVFQLFVNYYDVTIAIVTDTS